MLADSARPAPQGVSQVASESGEHGKAVGAARDSMTVAAWTIVSRATGVMRFAVIGAVLGPTFFGNTYQFTNSLPNLVYFGFLAGSLFSSLLVPALVSHIDDKGEGRLASERIAGGFLGSTLVMLLAVAPIAIVLGPLVLGFGALGGDSHGLDARAEMGVGLVLIILFIPQVFLYAVVGTATAVMNSRRRFALAAGAPAIENLGTMAVLGAAALFYGTDTSLSHVTGGEIALLGIGSTAAVALHAATQWWGARRAGVVLVPRPGWRDPDVRIVVRRAVPSLAQAGLASVQVLVLFMIANRLAGGVVAFQISLNFYYLAIAVGATPVALSVLPRLARLDLARDTTAFRDTLVRSLALGLLVAIPAAVGYAVLAMPLARAISFGRMASNDGVAMVAAALAALSLAVIGQTVFSILTYASYARKDTRTPLVSMGLQAAVCLGLAATALLFHGSTVLLVLGFALSLSVCAAALHLSIRTWRSLSRRGTERLAPSLARFAAGAAIMAGPAWLVADNVPSWLGRSLGPRLAIAAAVLVGAAVFLALQALWHSPELGWILGGLAGSRQTEDRRVMAEAVNG